MDLHTLKPGDRLLTKKGVVTHSGTYMGDGLVAHISPKKNIAVENVSLFADGQQPKVVRNGGIDKKRLWAALEEFKQRPAYSVLSNNCEDLCNFLERGMRMSPQRKGAALGSITGYGIAKALDVKNPYVTALCVLGGAWLGMAANSPDRFQTETPQQA